MFGVYLPPCYVKHYFLSFNPIFYLFGQQFDANAQMETVAMDAIPEEWMGLDVGPKTVESFGAALEPCKTIVS